MTNVASFFCHGMKAGGAKFMQIHWLIQPWQSAVFVCQLLLPCLRPQASHALFASEARLKKTIHCYSCSFYIKYEYQTVVVSSMSGYLHLLRTKSQRLFTVLAVRILYNHHKAFLSNGLDCQTAPPRTSHTFDDICGSMMKSCLLFSYRRLLWNHQSKPKIYPF